MTDKVRRRDIHTGGSVGTGGRNAGTDHVTLVAVMPLGAVAGVVCVRSVVTGGSVLTRLTGARIHSVASLAPQTLRTSALEGIWAGGEGQAGTAFGTRVVEAGVEFRAILSYPS